MGVSKFPGERTLKMQAGHRKSSRDKMYVKCFESKMTVFKIFKFSTGFGPRMSRCSQGAEHGSRMQASAGGDGRGRCRGS
ncbi:unnamed protein product, partial [Staurois parvus]